MKEKLLSEMLDAKLVAIVRGVPEEKLERLFDALYKGGVKFVELTFDSTGKIPDEKTASVIASLKEKFSGKVHVGAGTVITKKQAELAYKAGAEYLISPTVDTEIIKYCNENGMISMPGAMTPTEILTAYNSGADLIKLFPSDSLGLPYIKAVTAPLKHIPLIAVGGVTVDNVTEFLSVVKGVGIGSGIVKKDMVANDDFDGITELAKKFTDKIKAGA